MELEKINSHFSLSNGSNFFWRIVKSILAELKRPSSPAGELACLLVCLLIGLATAYWPYYLDHRFYFNDDEQTAPYYLEIGHQLRNGHWPFLTLGTMSGGNLILDWQEALFNPISLFLYWLVAPMHDLNVIGLVMAGFYICLMSLGGYVLARSFGISRLLSVVAASVLCTNNFVSFMYSHSWLTCLVAWATPGTVVEALHNPTGEREAFQVEEQSGGSTLIFARLWWPGYGATLNGLSVETKPFEDFLVSVNLPPGAHGLLLLTYVPPGYRWEIGLAMFGLIILMVMVVLNVKQGLTRSYDAV